MTMLVLFPVLVFSVMWIKNAVAPLISLGLVLTLAGCGAGEGGQNPPPPAVSVAEVTVRDTPVVDQWVGTLEGYTVAKVRAQVAGNLLRQAYDNGTLVGEGDLMFEVDPRPFEATLARSEGQLAEAVARLGTTKLHVERYRPLAEVGAISQQELDDAVQAMREAEAAVFAAEAAVESARINLQFTRIESPLTGLASIATAQVGDLVGPSGEVMATVSAVDPIKVNFYISEQDYLVGARHSLARRNEGESPLPDFDLVLILADGSTYDKKGKVIAVDSQIDVRTGSILIQGSFANPDLMLRPGQFARIRGQVGMLKDAILIPQRAVNELQGSYQVAVVDSSDVATMRSVTPGQRDGDMWVISEGLKKGDRVVVEGLQKVRSGAKVTIAPPPSAAKGKAPADGKAPAAGKAAESGTGEKKDAASSDQKGATQH